MSHHFLIAQINYANKQRWPVTFSRADSFSLSILKALYSYGLINSFWVNYKEISINKRCYIYLKYKHGAPVFFNFKLFWSAGHSSFITKHKLLQMSRRNPGSLFFLSSSKGIIAYNYKNLSISGEFWGGILLFSVDLW